jgi:hypothetical protein
MFGEPPSRQEKRKKLGVFGILAVDMALQQRYEKSA